MTTNDSFEKLEYQKVLNYISRYCVTDNGKEIVLSIRPLPDIKTIEQKGKAIGDAKEILIKNDFPPFEYLPDLTEILFRSRIEGVFLSSKQILEVLKLAVISRKMHQFLKSSEFGSSYLSNLRNSLFVDKVFEHHINGVILENGDIRDDTSAKLKEIRIEIREKESALQKIVKKMLKQLSELYLVQEEYITQRDGRIVLPVKAEHKRHVRGFVHSESSTGQTVYIEPEETLEMNNEILSLSFAEKREIEKILKTVTRKIGEQSELLIKSLNAIAELDSIFASAKYSIEIIGSFPSFEENKPFEIIDARHPLLIKKIGYNNTVPLNLKMIDETVVLITGPNAGGKTVTLKTTGLLVLLAQSGIHIPLHPDSNFHFFTNVLVDIGDAQSIEDDLSTFSSHLTNIKRILDEAYNKSLVLVDEIGTGTDPAEGSAIATGVLITLRDKGAKVLATTHHGSLKLIANQLAKFQNASMEFDTDELKPTYRFKQGMPGSSYAFEVASRIGMDDEIMNLCKEYLDPDKSKIETFLVDIERKSKELKNEIHKLEIENLRLKSLANLYQQKIDKLEKQKKEIIEETREKAQVYLKDINKQIETVIKNIKESNADKQVIKAEKQKIETVKKETREFFTKEIKKEEKKIELNVGDYAAISNTTSVGIIDELDKTKDKAVLVIGSIKIKTKYSDLIPAKKSEIETPTYPRIEYDYNAMNYRLDIRGKRADEAEKEIISFLDNSNMMGIERIEILHGKGTGALKQLVQSIIKNYDAVKNYYYASIESGGDGVTIVELK